MSTTLFGSHPIHSTNDRFCKYAPHSRLIAPHTDAPFNDRNKIEEKTNIDASKLKMQISVRFDFLWSARNSSLLMWRECQRFDGDKPQPNFNLNVHLSAIMSHSVSLIVTIPAIRDQFQHWINKNRSHADALIYSMQVAVQVDGRSRTHRIAVVFVAIKDCAACCRIKCQ